MSEDPLVIIRMLVRTFWSPDEEARRIAYRVASEFIAKADGEDQDTKELPKLPGPIKLEDPEPKLSFEDFEALKVNQLLNVTVVVHDRVAPQHRGKTFECVMFRFSPARATDALEDLRNWMLECRGTDDHTWYKFHTWLVEKIEVIEC